MRHPASQRAAVLSAGIGALLGGLAVTLLGPTIDAPTPRAAPMVAPRSASSDAQVLELLRKLDRNLQSLAVAVTNIDRIPEPVRVPIDASSAGHDRRESPSAALDERELADALRALTQLMERIPQSHAGSSLPSRDFLPVADKPAALGSGSWSAPLRHGVESPNETSKRHRSLHHGWSSDDLGLSYGYPDELWFEEGEVTVWLYEYMVQPGVYESQFFYLKDGMVFDSEVDCWTDEKATLDSSEFGAETGKD